MYYYDYYRTLLRYWRHCCYGTLKHYSKYTSGGQYNWLRTAGQHYCSKSYCYNIIYCSSPAGRMLLAPPTVASKADNYKCLNLLGEPRCLKRCSYECALNTAILLLLKLSAAAPLAPAMLLLLRRPSTLSGLRQLATKYNRNVAKLRATTDYYFAHMSHDPF